MQRTCSEEGCTERPAVAVKYLSKVLCKDHFLRYIESRALQTIERYNFIQDGEKWAIAMSGGKDSQVCHHYIFILSAIFFFLSPFSSLSSLSPSPFSSSSSPLFYLAELFSLVIYLSH